jgi:hypothetical protein
MTFTILGISLGLHWAPKVNDQLGFNNGLTYRPKEKDFMYYGSLSTPWYYVSLYVGNMKYE